MTNDMPDDPMPDPTSAPSAGLLSDAERITVLEALRFFINAEPTDVLDEFGLERYADANAMQQRARDLLMTPLAARLASIPEDRRDRDDAERYRALRDGLAKDDDAVGRIHLTIHARGDETQTTWYVATRADLEEAAREIREEAGAARPSEETR